MAHYDDSFYREGSEIALSSARVMVPLIMKMIKPQSVVDVGCGAGEWLSEFHRSGVGEILGIDGEWVPPNQLRIPRSAFVPHDLSKPIKVNQTFDLAVSLEVAEHLSPSQADPFVQEIKSLAPVVLFSAAIPFQGGVGHENEQWPDYWAALFKKYHYTSVDCVRKQVWSNPAVAYWYSQNCFIAVRQDIMHHYPFLSDTLLRYGDDLPPLVHPMNYYMKVKRLVESEKALNQSVRSVRR